MSVAGYLTTVALSLVPALHEEESIAASIATLRSRLSTHFGDELEDQFRFGSSMRGTKLPRGVDSRCDVDYLIVFDARRHPGPQALVDRLRAFVREHYSASQIVQMHPSVVLSLDGGLFELVPARLGSRQTLYIPAPDEALARWIRSDPHGFALRLDAADRHERHLIRPLIRLLKYWNARRGYIYDSYALERWIVGRRWYWGVGTLRNYFYETAASLPKTQDMPAWKRHEIKRAKTLVAGARACEARGQGSMAEQEIRKLVPDPQRS